MEPMMGVWPIYLSLGESPWNRLPLSGKGARGLAVAGSKVYVAQYFSDSVAVHDQRAAADAAISTIALGPPPVLTDERRGHLLFEDATICFQQWQSCASCHPDARADGLNWDLVNDGTGNRKNTKSMLFSHRTAPAMATGIRESAEAAVRAGLNHILFTYRPDQEAEAIDAHLRSLRPVPSPHLRDGRMTPAARRGEKLFYGERINCGRCHPAPLYTDRRRHNVGTRRVNEYTDRFDTPTLIEVWRTAPYLHDGRYTTIEELLVDGRHGLRRTGAVDLSEQEIADLVAFVLSL
jgi:cytochrome c peroxidase